MNGGKLIQNVSGHARGETHNMITEHGDVISINSTHHQMMFPFDLPAEDYVVLGKANKRLSEYYMCGSYERESLPCEPEVVYYPKTNNLAIQYHPEMMMQASKAVLYAKQLICKYLFNGEVILPSEAEQEVKEEFSGELLLEPVPNNLLRRFQENPVRAEQEQIIPRPVFHDEELLQDNNGI